MTLSNLLGVDLLRVVGNLSLSPSEEGLPYIPSSYRFHLLYPFPCWWTFSLLPYPGYCKYTAVNIGVHVSFWIMISSGYMPSSGIGESRSSSIFSFLRNLHVYNGILKVNSESASCSVMSKPLWPHGLQPARLLCPQNSPGKNSGVGSQFLSPGYLPNPGIIPRSPRLEADSLPKWAIIEAPMEYYLAIKRNEIGYFVET